MFIYRGEKPPCGSILIVDIDGVLADASAHQHFLKAENQDWASFFAASADIPIVVEGLELVEKLSSFMSVVLLTARPFSLADTTVKWLNKNKIYWDVLAMRAENDERSSPEVKLEIVKELEEEGYQPALALDDDPRNILMYIKKEILTIYVHSGYYED